MAIQISGQSIKTGAPGQALAQDQQNALIVTELNPRYYKTTTKETLLLSSVYGGSTLVAASAIGQTAWNPAVGIYNPVNSGKNCVIIWGVGTFVSGTPTAGGLVWGYVAPNAGVTAAGGNNSVNTQNLVTGTSTAKTFLQSAMTGSAASVMLAPLTDAFAGAVAATSTNTATFDEVAGLFVCPPGGVIGISGTLGTTTVVQCSMAWVELPI